MCFEGVNSTGFRYRDGADEEKRTRQTREKPERLSNKNLPAEKEESS